jgi:hypothetical protein
METKIVGEQFRVLKPFTTMYDNQSFGSVQLNKGDILTIKDTVNNYYSGLPLTYHARVRQGNREIDNVIIDAEHFLLLAPNPNAILEKMAGGKRKTRRRIRRSKVTKRRVRR